MKNKKISSIVTIILISFLVLSGCAKKRDENIIKIGAILPLTGKLSAFGSSQQKALILAEEFINNNIMKSDKQIKFVFEDSEAETKKAVTIIDKMIHIDKIKLIFLFKTTLVEAVKPIVEKEDVLLFAFCMDPEIAADSDKIFRIYPNMNQQSKVMLDYLKDSKDEKIGILYISTPATEAIIPNYLEPGLENLGKKVVGLESFDSHNLDFKNHALKLKTSNPDLIITLAHFVYIPQIIKSFNEAEILGDINILGDLSYTEDIDVPNKLLDGIKFVSPIYALKSTDEIANTDFQKRYFENYSTYPGYDPAFFYDTALILALGIDQYGENLDQLSNYLHIIKDYKGETGKITILETGDADVDMVIGIFKDGEKKQWVK